MAREIDAMVTFNDLRYMNNNEDFIANKTIKSSEECTTKSEIIEHLYIYEAYLGTGFVSNQLVPYHRLKPGTVKFQLFEGETNKDDAYNNNNLIGDFWHRKKTTYPSVGDFVYTVAVGNTKFTNTNDTVELLYYRIVNSDVLIAISPDGEVVSSLDMSQTLSISPTSINRDSDATTFNVSVSSNSDWLVSENSDWITISQSSGTGNGSFTVNISENTGDSRNTTITVRNPDGANVSSVSISQDSATATFQHTLSTASNSSDVCSFSKYLTMYTDDSNFTSSTKLYSGSSGVLETSSGYYSDHSGWIYWNASTQEVTSVGICGSAL